MSDEKKPRPKTRDLRAIQAEATEAARLADQMAAERDKAKAKSAEAARKARSAQEKAKRLSVRLQRAKERDAYERIGKAFVSFINSLPEADKADWCQGLCSDHGLTQDAWRTLGYDWGSAPAQEFVVPGQSDA